MLALYKTAGPSTEAPPGDLEKNTVYLTITSKPGGARVTIDGDIRGSTPLKLWIPAGKYEIAIEKEGFYSWKAGVTLNLPMMMISRPLLPKDER